MGRRWAAALILAGAAVPAGAQAPRLALSLAEAETRALGRSPALGAAESDAAAALAQVDAQFSLLLPRLTADGSYQYQTEVPTLSFVPGAPPVKFGDNRSWSVGSGLSYTLFDAGALRSAWRGQKALARSAKAQRDLARRQLRLMARLDYFQVQVALEQERSLADSLRLAQAQYKDIGSRYRAGAVSRVDWLSAHEQVLGRLRELRASQAEAAASLRTLFSLTGQGEGLDLSAPLDARVESIPEGVAAPSVIVALEELEAVERRLAPAAAAAPDPRHPQLAVYAEQADAQRLAAEGTAAGAWPRLQLGFKSAYQYPELPLLRSYWQNTAQVSASVPLFEYGRTRSLARAQRAQSEAALRREAQASDDLARDYGRARDQLGALRDQEELDGQSVAETEEIARLRYASYRDGGSTILDVETANVAAVQARVTAARTRARALIQLATLESLEAAP